MVSRNRCRLDISFAVFEQFMSCGFNISPVVDGSAAIYNLWNYDTMFRTVLTGTKKGKINHESAKGPQLNRKKGLTGQVKTRKEDNKNFYFSWCNTPLMI